MPEAAAPDGLGSALPVPVEKRMTMRAVARILATFPRKALVVPLALALALLVVRVPEALAHSTVERSEPEANAVLDAAPQRIRLWFAEAPELRFTEVRLLDQGGVEVQGVGSPQTDANDSTLLSFPLPQLPPGVYTVAWRTTSAADGHGSSGAFAFAVGRDQALSSLASGPATGAGGSTNDPTPADATVRWLGYFAYALLAGGFAFAPLVLRPADITLTARARGSSPRSSWQEQGGPAAVASSTRSGSIVEPLSTGILVMLTVGWVAAVVANALGAARWSAAGAGEGIPGSLDSSILVLVTETRYGALVGARLLVLAPMGALVALGWRLVRRRPVPKQWWWVGLGLSGGLLLLTSLGSHAAAGPESQLAVVADWLHMVGASLWLGGLVALSITLPGLRRSGGAAPDGDISRLVGRFSQVATLCVVTLGVTGFYRAFVQVGDWRNLLDTAYGTTLLVKVGLLFPLLGLAALNMLLIRRRIVSAESAPRPQEGLLSWQRRLRGTVGGEVALVSAILLATSVLASLPPAREAFGPGMQVRGEDGGVRAVVVLSPGRPGFNSFDLYLRDQLGRPISDAQRVSLDFTAIGQGLDPSEAIASNLGGGHYVARGGYVSMLAAWRIDVLVRRPDEEDALMSFVLR